MAEYRRMTTGERGVLTCGDGVVALSTSVGEGRDKMFQSLNLSGCSLAYWSSASRIQMSPSVLLLRSHVSLGLCGREGEGNAPVDKGDTRLVRRVRQDRTDELPVRRDTAPARDEVDLATSDVKQIAQLDGTWGAPCQSGTPPRLW